MWKTLTSLAIWVSEQLDTRLNNYGKPLVNCVNNCTCIFTRHQPRIFLNTQGNAHGYKILKIEPLYRFK